MEYTKQINKVIDYITHHLDSPLPAEKLAGVAGLSEFHFHRVFRSEVGETIAKFITRKRLEKAGRQLLRNEDVLVAEIASDTGFSSASLFCRNFKRYFGMTPQEYRSRCREQDRRNSQSESTKIELPNTYAHYFCSRKTLKIGEKTMDCTFEIKTLEPKHVIYARHTGAFDKMGEAFQRLMQWAYPRGLVKGMPCLGAVYLDDPEITPTDKLQSDAFLVVDEDVKVEGGIGKYTITGGRYAVGRFEIAMSEFGEAWQSMCELITNNGCVSIDGFHYEMYLNNAEEHPEKKFLVDICIPVKPA